MIRKEKSKWLLRFLFFAGTNAFANFNPFFSEIRVFEQLPIAKSSENLPLVYLDFSGSRLFGKLEKTPGSLFRWGPQEGFSFENKLLKEDVFFWTSKRQSTVPVTIPSDSLLYSDVVQIQGGSRDGSRLVGLWKNAEGVQQGFLFTQNANSPLFPFDPLKKPLTAVRLSQDGGSVACGTIAGAERKAGLYVWTFSGGLHELGVLPTAKNITPQSISNQGESITGWYVNQENLSKPFLWTKETGLVDLALGGGMLEGKALSMTADGKTIVGFVQDPAGHQEAVLWKGGEQQSLKEFLSESGLKETAFLGGTIDALTDISGDGKSLAGAFSSPFGGTAPFIVRLGTIDLEQYFQNPTTSLGTVSNLAPLVQSALSTFLNQQAGILSSNTPVMAYARAKEKGYYVPIGVQYPLDQDWSLRGGIGFMQFRHEASQQSIHYSGPVFGMTLGYREGPQALGFRHHLTLSYTHAAAYLERGYLNPIHNHLEYSIGEPAVKAISMRAGSGYVQRFLNGLQLETYGTLQYSSIYRTSFQEREGSVPVFFQEGTARQGDIRIGFSLRDAPLHPNGMSFYMGGALNTCLLQNQSLLQGAFAGSQAFRFSTVADPRFSLETKIGVNWLIEGGFKAGLETAYLTNSKKRGWYITAGMEFFL